MRRVNFQLFTSFHLEWALSSEPNTYNVCRFKEHLLGVFYSEDIHYKEGYGKGQVRQLIRMRFAV